VGSEFTAVIIWHSFMLERFKLKIQFYKIISAANQRSNGPNQLHQDGVTLENLIPFSLTTTIRRVGLQKS
jgi:hypothetical protein